MRLYPISGPNLLDLLGIRPNQNNDLPSTISQPRPPSSPPGLPLVSGVLSLEQLERTLHNSQPPPPPRPTLPSGHMGLRGPFDPPSSPGPFPQTGLYPGQNLTRPIPPFGYPSPRFAGPIRGEMPPGFAPFHYLPPGPAMMGAPGAYPHPYPFLPPSSQQQPQQHEELMRFPRSTPAVANNRFNPLLGQGPQMRPFQAFPTFGGLSNPMMGPSAFQNAGTMSQNMFTQIQVSVTAFARLKVHYERHQGQERQIGLCLKRTSFLTNTMLNSRILISSFDKTYKYLEYKVGIFAAQFSSSYFVILRLKNPLNNFLLSFGCFGPKN